MLRNNFLAVFSLLWMSTLAGAAEPAAQWENARPTYNEIERGFYASLRAGPWFYFRAPTVAGVNGPFSVGQAFGVQLGVDFMPYLSAEAFFQFTANRAGADYKGQGDGSASGDFSAMIPGLALKASLYGFKDNQAVKRTWIFIRLGGGYVRYSPSNLLPNNDVLIFGGPGIEYFSRLRHFSVGIEATVQFMAKTSTAGLAITPSVRYAF